MATAKKTITKNKSLSETEKKLEAARKRNKARRATIKINSEKNTDKKNVSNKSSRDSKTKTTRTAKTTKTTKTTKTVKPSSKSVTKKSSSTPKKKVSNSATSSSKKPKKTRESRKKHPVLVHIMDMPRWARFIVYTIVLVIVLYGYYLHSKEQLVSASVDFLNRNIFIIAPLTFVLLYSLTLFYLGYRAGKNR
ncbi:hypothetical protein [Priestia megaterium]|uniref:Uncharacterized protein n=1 Tax=Priestia megaterium TaxID=1404 RepID=A0A6M6E696_PRIMG|nr:hypothetical protein [Priestia megaterium]QJX80037.1 hypothetical protein FDZ14_28445 [Priestia megaterium]